MGEKKENAKKYLKKKEMKIYIIIIIIRENLIKLYVRINFLNLPPTIFIKLKIK